MKIGLWSDSSNIFDYKNSRDKYSYRWYALKEEFKSKDISLEIFESNNQINKFDVVIENGIRDINHHNKYLLIIESPHVRPQDWNENKHKEYLKIFCWDDALVDNKKYFKHNLGHYLPRTIPKVFNDKKLCCTIAGNKRNNNPHPDELYTKRVEYIRWFEKHHIDEFDLYGTGWDQYRFGHSELGRILNKIKFLRNKDQFPSYKGVVESKFHTMTNYKFSICYENVKDTNGYISEKIFDCFIAGCIPIYWGCKAVSDYIPKKCFIDKRDFDCFEEIYDYMKQMDKKSYLNYLDNIEDFLNCEKSDLFRGETFAKNIAKEILKDLDDNR